MCSKGLYDSERLSRARGPPQSHPTGDGYHRVANIVPKKPPLLARPGEGSYNRHCSRPACRDNDKGHSFSRARRRSRPPHRGDKPSCKWTRDDHSTSRQPEYRDTTRDGFRRKRVYSSSNVRDRSPRERGALPVSRKDSPHSRPVDSSSSYSPERSKTYSSRQSQRRSKGRLVQSSKASRDTSPSHSSAMSSSKVLDKPSGLTEKQLAEVVSKQAAAKQQKADERNLPGISEYGAGPTAPLLVRPESNATDGRAFLEDSHLNHRSQAIISKAKEIEHIYQQCRTTFMTVVQMLIKTDPSLEKSMQCAVRQNLQAIGEWCIQELGRFIAKYNTSNQDFGESF